MVMNSHWVRGVCDRMFVVVLEWQRRWETGAVAATRPYLHLDGRTEDIPTQRAVKVSWSQIELDHLVRILQVFRPEWEFTCNLVDFSKGGFSKGRLLPGGRRLAEMVTYKADVEELVILINDVRLGRAGRKTVAEEITSGSFWDGTE